MRDEETKIEFYPKGTDAKMESLKIEEAKKTKGFCPILEFLLDRQKDSNWIKYASDTTEKEIIETVRDHPKSMVFPFYAHEWNEEQIKTALGVVIIALSGQGYNGPYCVVAGTNLLPHINAIRKGIGGLDHRIAAYCMDAFISILVPADEMLIIQNTPDIFSIGLSQATEKLYATVRCYHNVAGIARATFKIKEDK